MSTSAREGKVAVDGGKIWYRLAGAGAPGTPVVIVNGGPGLPHDYLEGLAALDDERPVLFYDQLGSGTSNRPGIKSLYTIERYGRELQQLRDALGLARLHIFAHSWGTMLAVDYALAGAQGIASMVLASACLDVPRFLRDALRYREALPDDARAALDRGDASGDRDDPAYQAAMVEFYKRHLCRIFPFPAPLVRSLDRAGFDVYEHMWGPNEFTATGTLRDYDRTAALGKLAMPVLYTCGRYDECAPDTVDAFHRATPGSELAVFEEAAHVPHLEQADAYLSTVRDFLRRADVA